MAYSLSNLQCLWRNNIAFGGVLFKEREKESDRDRDCFIYNAPFWYKCGLYAEQNIFQKVVTGGPTWLVRASLKQLYIYGVQNMFLSKNPWMDTLEVRILYMECKVFQL